MKYQVSILNGRIKFLQEQLGNRITILETDGDFTIAEITVSDGIDLINIFHAGIMCGANNY